MSLVRSLAALAPQLPAVRRNGVSLRASDDPLGFDEWVGMFGAGSMMPFILNPLGAKEEEISHTVSGLTAAFRTNGAVFACELVRVMLFSEARFQFRRLDSGRPGELFGNKDLAILERPEGPGSTTATMLKRAMLHADFGGTGFMVERKGQIKQPRPDWMTVVLGSYEDPELDGDDLDAEVIGYLFHPGGRGSGKRPVTLLPDQVATFVPLPDPLAHVRGIPWVSAVTKYVMGHNAASTHKLKFFENGATPQLVVSLDKDLKDPVKFRQWIEVLEQDHKGVTNAYRTMYLGAGAVPTVVGNSVQQLDFKATQGADETMIAAAAGVGAVVAQLSEGLQGSSLNTGNFAMAMRRVADITMRPLWRDMAGSLGVLVPPPGGAELWYDDRDIPALKDDVKDAAEVQSLNSTAIRTLADGGWEPDSAVDAIVSGDLRKLVHSGKLSVQLQDPNKAPAPAPAQPGPPPAAGDQAPPPTGQAPPGPAAGPVVIQLTSGPALLPAANPVRCRSCRKLLAESATAPYRITCSRCKAVTELGAYAPDEERDDHGRFAGPGGGSSAGGESVSAGPGIEAPREQHDADKHLWDRFADGKGGYGGPFSTEVRTQIKIQNANAIGSRLEDRMGRDAILATPFGAEMHDAYPELEVGPAVVAGMQDAWADTSGDHSSMACAMQIATQREFGLTSANDINQTYDNSTDPGFQSLVKDELDGNGALYQAATRAEYEETQTLLALDGVKELTLYRGMALQDDSPIAQAYEGRSPGAFDAQAGYTSNPMSSFAADSTTAAQFAANAVNYQGQKSYIMSVKVPASRVLSTAMSGRGCMGEYEAVVLAGEGDTATVWR